MFKSFSLFFENYPILLAVGIGGIFYLSAKQDIDLGASIPWFQWSLGGLGIISISCYIFKNHPFQSVGALLILALYIAAIRMVYKHRIAKKRR